MPPPPPSPASRVCGAGSYITDKAAHVANGSYGPTQTCYCTCNRGVCTSKTHISSRAVTRRFSADNCAQHSWVCMSVLSSRVTKCLSGRKILSEIWLKTGNVKTFRRFVGTVNSAKSSLMKHIQPLYHAPGSWNDPSKENSE